MNNSVKKEAIKQYFSYFKWWFGLIGLLFVIFVVSSVMSLFTKGLKAVTKQDTVSKEAVAERVFDYADVLTSDEEQGLREYIAKKEAEYKVHIVLLITNEDFESQGNWESVARSRADVFYTQNKYGYNKVGGDGIILIDNWYPDQEGSWVVTSGLVYEVFNSSEVDEVLDAVYYSLEYGKGEYKAYKAYVDKVCELLDDPANKEGGSAHVQIPIVAILFLPPVVALIFAFTHLNQKAAAVTTTTTTYVAGGRPVMKMQNDDFIRKNVITRRIESSSSSGGGSSRSGGRGGSFSSSGGGSRGGGGRRR